MDYVTFGRTGIQVSNLALGTGNFGTGWGYGADADAARTIFDAYVDAGGNFIDTADVYQFGQSEEIVGDLCFQIFSKPRYGCVSRMLLSFLKLFPLRKEAV